MSIESIIRITNGDYIPVICNPLPFKSDPIKSVSTAVAVAEKLNAELDRNNNTSCS